MLLPLVVLLLLAGLALWRFAVIEPRWYHPPDPADARVAALAERVEYRLVEEAQKVRQPGASWTLRIREHQVNAWMVSRLPKWLANQPDLTWPAELGTPQMRIEDDRLSVAVEVFDNGQSHFLVASVVPTIEDDQMRLVLERVAIGRVAVPGAPLDGLLEVLGRAGTIDRSDPGLNRLLDVLAGRQAIDPMFHLADDRRVRVLGLRCQSGMIDVTCRTEPPEPEREGARARMVDPAPGP